MGSDIWLEAEPSVLPEARAAISLAAARAGFDDTASFEITLAASEALNNAIEHGTPCGGGKILLRLAPTTGALAVEVTDCGEYASVVPPPFDPQAVRGRGLAVMHQLVDAVEVMVNDDDCTQIRLIKRVDLSAA